MLSALSDGSGWMPKILTLKYLLKLFGLDRGVHFTRAKQETLTAGNSPPAEDRRWRKMTSQRFGFVMTAAALAALGVSGCASKNYVRTQTGPLINHSDQLDQKSAENNRAIHDVNDRAQAGITKAQS